MGKRKRHGPRYAVKGKKKAWVVRDKKGRFKKWVRKKRSLATDRVWKARLGKKPGYGFKVDYNGRRRR